MTATLTGWLGTLWDHPVARVLLVLIAAEVVVILAQIAWLAASTARSHWRQRVARRFEAGPATEFLDALEQPELRELWVRRARSYPEAVVREFLESFLQATAGNYRWNALQIYDDLGFLARDLADARSRFWHRRMLAMRRLYLAASREEREAPLRHRDDLYPIRVLAARVASRIGTADDLFELLRDLDLPRRLMEQPVFSLLRAIPRPIFEELLERWDRFRSPRMRRILLVASARGAPHSCLRWLPQAAADPTIEVRMGACLAAGQLSSEESFDIALRLLDDAEWRVRAQAVRALGELRDARALEPLARAMHDRAFWTRQNAAAALRRLGEAGERRLIAIAAQHEDAFAAETARQEIQREAMLATGGAAA